MHHPFIVSGPENFIKKTYVNISSQYNILRLSKNKK